jgi:hypothetical protein
VNPRHVWRPLTPMPYRPRSHHPVTPQGGFADLQATRAGG